MAELRTRSLSTRRAWPYGVALAVFALLALPAGRWPAWGQDEGTYTSQAEAVLHGQLSWSTYWYDHPPMGWVLLALPMKVLTFFTNDAVTSARLVSAVSVTVSAALVYGIASRISGRRWVAVVAPLMVLTSMLTWGMFRMVYLDTYAVPLILLGTFLVLDPKRRLWAFILGAAAIGLGVLSKETFLLTVPGIAYLAWQRQTDRDPETRRILRPFAITGFAVMGAAVVVMYPIMAAMKGELLPTDDRVSLWDAIMFQLSSRGGSGTLFQEGSARHALWASWIADDRTMAVLLVASLGLVFVRRWRWLSIATVGFVAPAVIGSGYLPVMHVIGFVPLAALALAAWADVVASLVSGRQWRLAAAPLIPLVIVGLGVRAEAVTAVYGEDANGLNREVVTWFADHADHSRSVALDGSLLIAVSENGWALSEATQGGMAIPHEKLDLDPKFAATLDRCDPGYVIVTQQVRTDIESLGLKKLQALLATSTVLWEKGGIEIREVSCQ